MDKVLAAIKQLLEDAQTQGSSKIADIKRVYLGDPITIAESDQPAIIITPKSSEYDPRGNIYDQKNYIVDIILVIDQKKFFNSQASGSSLAITAAVRSGGIATLTVPGNTYIEGDDLTIESVDPDGYNGTFKVIAVGPGADQFDIEMPIDPGTYVSGGLARKDNVTQVFTVSKILDMVEGTISSLEVDDTSICGVIQNNQKLPYNGVNTCAYSNVNGVTYQFRSDRGWNTYEATVSVKCQQVANR